MSPDPTQAGGVLIVDDSGMMRAILRKALLEIGCERIVEASNGAEALEKLRAGPVDLILLDLDMPVMDGRETLRAIKSDPEWKVIPVIIVSGSGQESNAISCITAGAEDFLNKPFDPILLRARVVSSLERKQLRDQDRRLLAQLQHEKKLVELEKANSERLLLNILPRAVKERLESGEKDLADSHEAVTIGFLDIVGFSALAREHSPARLVAILDRFFGEFDRIADSRGAEKIKTIGDSYMFAVGVPVEQPGHAAIAAECALEMLGVFERVNAELGTGLTLRCGLHSGPVVAGIIGKRKFAYDIWGDAVNIASRMESTGSPGKIQISSETRELLGTEFRTTPRGLVECKGIGMVEGHYLEGRTPC
jgi:adenylate cyclase